MSYKKTMLILTLLLLGLSFLAWFHERWQADSRNEGEKQLLSFSPPEAEALTLSFPGDEKKSVRLNRANSEWFVTSPLRTPADFKVVTGFLHSLAAYEAGRLISTDQAVLGDFGLETPEAAIQVDWRREGRVFQKTLLVGLDTAVGYGVYVKLKDQPEVRMGSRHLRLLLGKSLFEWRKKEVLILDTGQLEEFSFQTKDERVRRYIRQPQGFCSPDDEKVRACLPFQAMQVLTKIGSMRAEGFFRAPEKPFPVFSLSYRLSWRHQGETPRFLEVLMWEGQLVARYQENAEWLKIPATLVRSLEELKKELSGVEL